MQGDIPAGRDPKRSFTGLGTWLAHDHDVVYPFLERVHALTIGVFIIYCPAHRVSYDVFADAVEGFLIPYDVLVIITLPDRCPRRATVFVDASRDGGFE